MPLNKLWNRYRIIRRPAPGYAVTARYRKSNNTTISLLEEIK